MNKLHIYTATLFLVLLLAGCGSSGSGDDDDDLFTPTLPADAARISAANANDIADGVFESISDLTLATAFRSNEALPSFQEILRSVTDRVKNRTIPPGMAAYRTEIQDCDLSSPQGTITVDFDQTASSADGSAVFSNCVIAGITIDGRITFDSTFNNTTGDYSDYFNGSLTISFGADSFTMVFDISDTGNFIADSFSTSMSFSVSGLPGGGFLVTTTQSLVGDDIGISSGEIVVQGADNTRLRVRVIALNTAAVDLDEGSGYTDNFLTCTDIDITASCS